MAAFRVIARSSYPTLVASGKCAMVAAR